MKIILTTQRRKYVSNAGIFLITAVIITAMIGFGGTCYRPSYSKNLEIRTWYDLDAVRDNLAGNHILLNNLNSTTLGYIELASPAANGGKGWQPIGTQNNPFIGSLDGQGYEIRDLFINRGKDYVGLFGVVYEGGHIENIGVVNADVTGSWGVGGLVAANDGTVYDSYFTGSVTGYVYVGGLVGGGVGNVSDSHSTGNVSGYGFVGGLMGGNFGIVSNSYATGSVTGNGLVGGLVGDNCDTVSNSYATGDVTGVVIEEEPYSGIRVGGLVGCNDEGNVSDSYSTGNVSGNLYVGGLVGESRGTVSNSYSSGSVNGNSSVGGLVGYSFYTVSNSYYNYDEVLINGENIITVGALFDEDFDQWLANDKFLDVNDRLSQENGYYMVNNVTDFKHLLAFGQNDTLKFKLTNDLDLATEPNFYIPYLAGEFDGNGHKISHLSFDFDFVSQVGLFGHLASGGTVHEVTAENVNITACIGVGGLVGCNDVGNVSDSYSTGNVSGNEYVGGLVGKSRGTLSNSYSSCTVTGITNVGGLMGQNTATVSNCYSTGNVTGDSRVGGLVGSYYGTVSDSFWDIETSGQTYSFGGIGKNTTEMKDIVTFSGAGWDIIEVALNETNPAYIWNIVNNVTYPFLSWQP